MLRRLRILFAKIRVYTRTKARKLKKSLGTLFDLNPITINSDLKANYNMTLRARKVKKQRRRLSLLYHLFVLFFFFSFLMFYDVADEDQYLFIYEFHKWW